MNGPLRDWSPVAKAVAALAVAFCIGLGLCGLSFALPSSDPEFHTNWLSMPSLLVMVLSALGLTATLFAWMIASIAGHRAGPQRLFDHDDENRRDQH
jgi:hypothetical protein